MAVAHPPVWQAFLTLLGFVAPGVGRIDEDTSATNSSRIAMHIVFGCARELRRGCIGKGGSGKTEVLYAAYLTPNGGGGGGHIIPMKIDPNSGNLTRLKSVLGPGNAVTVFADPSGKFLYASDFNTGVLWAYAIDPNTGNLTNLSGSPYSTQFAGNGGPMAIDPSGKFIFYVPNPSGAIVTFVRNTSDGSLNLSSGLIPIDNNQPFWLLVDPSGKFLYAADHSDPSGGEISVFAIDSTTGALTELPGSPFTFQANSEPWGLAMSSNGQFLFAALWNAGSVEALSVNSSTGGVSPSFIG